MPFHNLNLQFRTVAEFAAWLATTPRPSWGVIGSTYHNTYIPNESQWRGTTSMTSMQQTYTAKGWDRGPHVYLAAHSPDPADNGIWVMTPPDLPGIHAGACNDERFGIEIVGDFQSRPMSETQLTLLVETAAALHRHAGCGPDITAHRDCMPDRTCPGDAAYAQKPRIQQRLVAALAPPAAHVQLHGLVLTHAPDLDRVEESVIVGGYTTLKVVTAWGLRAAWTDAARARACALTCATVLRTHAGDPSSGKPYPHAAEVAREIAPWYAVRRHNLWIEIGNEPNSDPAVDPWGYRWHLDQAVRLCRASYPRARIIAPALVLDRGDPARWLDILADVYQACDAIGVHAYAYRAFDDAGQFATAQRLYARVDLPRALTEYGINDPATPDATKGARYAELVRSLPAPYVLATFYHLATDAPAGSQDAAYAIDLAGDRAYGAVHGAIGGI